MNNGINDNIIDYIVCPVTVCFIIKANKFHFCEPVSKYKAVCQLPNCVFSNANPT